MATFRMPVTWPTWVDSGVFPDLISNQITAATAPSIGAVTAYVLADGGTDEGVGVAFSIPKNYVGSPALVVGVVLDGAPGASDTLGFGFRKRAIANNEVADGTFDAEQVVSATIGSGGSNHANEDYYETTITLTAGDYAVDDQVEGYLYIDASGTSYTGNVLLRKIELQYTDV